MGRYLSQRDSLSLFQADSSIHYWFAYIPSFMLPLYCLKCADPLEMQMQLQIYTNRVSKSQNKEKGSRKHFHSRQRDLQQLGIFFLGFRISDLCPSLCPYLCAGPVENQFKL